MFEKKTFRPAAFLLLLGLLCSVVPQPSIGRSNSSAEYQSPYKVVFSFPKNELLRPNSAPPRDDIKLESPTRYENWYSIGTKKNFGAWGPEARRYPVIEGFSSLTPQWKRQRVLAVAYEMVGLPYQHHHIPDWNPPADWPWKTVAYGRNSKGLDCSDFSSWAYNYGLGIRLKTGILAQAQAESVSLGADDDVIQIRKIHDDGGYDSLVKKLVAGDLLYIRKKDEKEIGHVIIWLGKHGQSPDGTPLVIDCTGPDHTDCNGNAIPIGVQVRPFDREGHYYKSFVHASRIITSE